MLSKQLSVLGLTEQQARIYLKLLELGPSTVGTLTEHIDLPRISCYDALRRLASKGLITHVYQNRKRNYCAAPPERLAKIAHERTEKARKNEQAITSLIPPLERLTHSTLPAHPAATTYTTREGIKAVFDLMLNEKTILVISGTGAALQNLKTYFSQWHRKRTEKNINVRALFNAELRGKTLLHMPLADIRFLPPSSSSPTTTFIFGNHVAILIWSDLPVAILMNAQPIAQTYKNYFELVWKTANR